MKTFYSDVLIHLKRRYGKEELTSSLIKSNKDKDIEIGELKSEVDHYKYLLLNAQENFSVNTNKRFKESAEYKRLSDKLSKLTLAKDDQKARYKKQIETLNEDIVNRKKEIYLLKKRIKKEF